MERRPLGTAYTAVCDYLVKLFAKPPLTGTMLAVDETGVGRPVVDLLNNSGIQADVRPITITGGHEAHPAEGLGWKVPKKALVSTLQVLLQGRRLTVAKSLPFAAALVEELQNFQVKVTEAANETFGALGDGYHDDLVLAIMIAAWAAEHVPTGRVGVCMKAEGTCGSIGDRTLRSNSQLTEPTIPKTSNSERFAACWPGTTQFDCCCFLSSSDLAQPENRLFLGHCCSIA